MKKRKKYPYYIGGTIIFLLLSFLTFEDSLLTAPLELTNTISVFGFVKYINNLVIDEKQDIASQKLCSEIYGIITMSYEVEDNIQLKNKLKENNNIQGNINLIDSDNSILQEIDILDPWQSPYMLYMDDNIIMMSSKGSNKTLEIKDFNELINYGDDLYCYIKYDNKTKISMYTCDVICEVDSTKYNRIKKYIKIGPLEITLKERIPESM